jgi:hypothetical protein
VCIVRPPGISPPPEWRWARRDLCWRRK